MVVCTNKGAQSKIQIWSTVMHTAVMLMRYIYTTGQDLKAQSVVVVVEFSQRSLFQTPGR
jgi:hypothetical protein